mmetsp:Transcript_40676/g.77660  ORF Transcript_40676/g.77660 Transcript_40676/m.77660 type:complete len:229 (-) Transcript_40676:3394-4080(-)
MLEEKQDVWEGVLDAAPVLRRLAARVHRRLRAIRHKRRHQLVNQQHAVDVLHGGALLEMAGPLLERAAVNHLVQLLKVHELGGVFACLPEGHGLEVPRRRRRLRLPCGHHAHQPLGYGSLCCRHVGSVRARLLRQALDRARHRLLPAPRVPVHDNINRGNHGRQNHAERHAHERSPAESVLVLLIDVRGEKVRSPNGEEDDNGQQHCLETIDVDVDVGLGVSVHGQRE